jgi:hypothetical protein
LKERSRVLGGRGFSASGFAWFSFACGEAACYGLLVACVADHVFEWLATEEAADLFCAEAEGAVDELGRGAGDVGGDEEIGCGPERVSGRERLGFGDVDGGADVVFVEGFDERVGFDDGPACGVDEESALFHEGDFTGADETAGVGRERDDEEDYVGGGEQLVEF